MLALLEELPNKRLEELKFVWLWCDATDFGNPPKCRKAVSQNRRSELLIRKAPSLKATADFVQVPSNHQPERPMVGTSALGCSSSIVASEVGV